MNALTIVDWPVLAIFLGGAAIGMLVGYLLGGWRAESRSQEGAASRGRTRANEDAARTPRPTWRQSTWRPVVTDGDIARADGTPRTTRRAGDTAHSDLNAAIWDDGVEGPAILLIDDRLELLAVHAAYLRKHGYRTLLAEDGTTGLAFARAYHPALIVLDHSMPDRTGVEVARELKADASTADIPILFMTAHTYGAVGAAAMAAGCAAFLPKPVEPSRLLREIEARTPRH